MAPTFFCLSGAFLIQDKVDLLLLSSWGEKTLEEAIISHHSLRMFMLKKRRTQYRHDTNQ